jgi:hypothetical protein
MSLNPDAVVSTLRRVAAAEEARRSPTDETTLVVSAAESRGK